jgi:hypothetical protein
MAFPLVGAEGTQGVNLAAVMLKLVAGARFELTTFRL